MKRISPRLIKLGSLATLALGSIIVSSAGFAAPPPAATAAEGLQTETAHHTMMATDYRARMRTDEKRAIVWFTQANHCDQKAKQLRVASRQADLQISSQRDTAIL
jgi:hypothetical protein